MQGRNPLYTSCQKDYKNVAYKSGDSAAPDSHQWQPSPSKIVNEVNFDDDSLVRVNLCSVAFTELVENQLYEKSTIV